ncbi:MAG: N,N-dimethylformamidase beta subunit family domain-containing protein, partial [Archangium sp.]
MGKGNRLIGVLAAVLSLVSLVGGCQSSVPGAGGANGGGRDTPPLQRPGGEPPDIVDGGSPPSDGQTDGGTEPHDAQLIREENALPGTKAWRITRGANNNEIEGYALVSTVTQGEQVSIAVSVTGGPRKFTWEVYRLGYYGGLGAREMARGGPLQAVQQAPCPAQKPTGLVLCNWTPTLELDTDARWVRGVYVVKLVREDGYQRYVPFFVREAQPRSEVVVIIPTQTWQAYNTWGGTSLYDDKFHITGEGRAFQASFDRPYYRGYGSGHLLDDEQGLIMWLEAQGLDVAYVPDEEMDRSGDALVAAKVLVLSGHDEYWTRAQRDRADQALAEGRSIINLGANQAYWQVRLEPVGNRPRRLITCYKGDARDPVGPRSPDLTTKFRDLPTPRPENALLGVMFSSRWHQFAFPAVITNASHWAFEGTGLRNGDTLWRANGYEQDQVVDNGQSPAGLEVLAESPSLSLQGAFGFGQMAVFHKGSAWVFSAGGVDFVHTLGTTEAGDPRAARLVANVLYRALGRAVPKDLVVLPTTPLPRPRGPFASDVRTLAGQPGRRGDQDGGPGRGLLAAPVAVAVLPNGGGWAVADALANKVKRVAPDGSISTLSPVRLNGPLGIAADAQGNVYVSDSDNYCIRRIAPDGTTTVFAGAEMEPGSADGPAAQARFNQPAGLFITPQGELLVADLGNGVIRRIDLMASGNPVTT